MKKLRFGGNSAPSSTLCSPVCVPAGQREELAGCEVYGLDCIPNEREEAETLADRGSLKAQKEAPVRYGHKYSWVAPVDVGRVATGLSDSQTGGTQPQA